MIALLVIGMIIGAGGYLFADDDDRRNVYGWLAVFSIACLVILALHG